MATSKKSIATKASAIVLAVALLFGLGSYSYLTSSTDEIVNEFDENHNDVDIEETTGGEYDIVPGTSQDKDPTITATYTLDSYVFVEVTDDTNDLVTWYIANGWTLLDSASDPDNGVYVYYQLLEYDEDTAVEGVCTTVLHVLEGDKVYYSASITNEDMKDAEDVTLSFQAYIIQAEPFADAANAWLALNGDGVVINDSTGVVYSTLNDAIASVDVGTSASDLGKATSITLISDVNDASGISIPSYVDLTIDFNGHTYTLNGPGAGSTGTTTQAFQLLKDSTIVMKNGTVNIVEGNTTIYRIIQSYANVTLEDMTFDATNILGNNGYVLSFNNGTIQIAGSTSIINVPNNWYAFDVYYWVNSYPNGTTVTFDNSYTGTINGQIEYSTSDAEKAHLNIAGNGTFDGITLSSDASGLDNVNISITGGTFGTDVSSYVADGYTCMENSDGTYTVSK